MSIPIPAGSTPSDRRAMPETGRQWLPTPLAKAKSE
jgi:hypothetical protein